MDVEKIPTEAIQALTAEPAVRTLVLERPVLWGETWALDRPLIPIRFGEYRIEVERVGPQTLRIRESGVDRPPLLVGLGRPGGRLAYGHVRRELPVLLRLPRPIRLGPHTTFPVYSTYPIQPALFYEDPEGERAKILDLPLPPMPKALYGDPAGGILCDLHCGPAELTPAAVQPDKARAVLMLRLVNRSDGTQDAGVVMLDPPAFDFYVLGPFLCVNIVELHLFSETEADVTHADQPSLDGAVLVDRRLRDRARGPGLDLMRFVLRQRHMERGF